MATVVVMIVLGSPCGIHGHIFRHVKHSPAQRFVLLLPPQPRRECVNCVLKLNPKQFLIHSEGCSVNKSTCEGCGWYSSISIHFTFHMHF